MDFYRLREFVLGVGIGRNDQAAFGQGERMRLGTQLNEIKHRRPRQGTTVGDFGQSARLLKELHHFQFCSHKIISSEVIAGRMPVVFGERRIHGFYIGC